MCYLWSCFQCLLQLVFSVHCQIIFPSKAHSTGTFVRFFTGVYQNMFLHIILSWEAQVTVRTFVWFFTSVSHVVGFQVAPTLKSSTTNITSVHFSQVITFNNARRRKRGWIQGSFYPIYYCAGFHNVTEDCLLIHQNLWVWLVLANKPKRHHYAYFLSDIWCVQTRNLCNALHFVKSHIPVQFNPFIYSMKIIGLNYIIKLMHLFKTFDILRNSEILMICRKELYKGHFSPLIPFH